MDKKDKRIQEDKDSDDPYSTILNESDSSKLQNPELDSSRQRKLKKITNKLYEIRAQGTQGFIMGAMIGGTFGGILGIYQAIQTRSLVVIPLSILISGCSFGFFLACGSVIRNDELDQININNCQQLNNYYYLNNYWRQKYSIRNNQEN